MNYAPVCGCYFRLAKEKLETCCIKLFHAQMVADCKELVGPVPLH